MPKHSDQADTAETLVPQDAPVTIPESHFAAGEEMSSGSEAPQETAVQQSPPGGGATHYSDDFGEILAGLDLTKPDWLPANLAVPAFLATLSGALAILPPVAPAAPAAPAEPDAPTIPSEPVDLGPVIFTSDRDLFDFLGFSSLTDGAVTSAHYDALAGNDSILLPADVALATSIGWDSDRIFQAGDGDDYVVGGLLDDRIAGGAGNDFILGMEGNDSLDGGDGSDLIMGFGGDDTFTGGEGYDIFWGLDGNDVGWGGNGPDSLIGGNGDDSLYGGDDNDTIRGDSGSDYLAGGAGDDRLSAAEGDDTLDGGDGSDTFFFSLAYDGGNDVITNFELGSDGDVLVLEDFLDVTFDFSTSIANLDGSGHVVSSTAGGVAIDFATGGHLEIGGSFAPGIGSFADLVDAGMIIEFG